MSWRKENDGFIKTWAQDIRNSYKVRLKYALLPKGVKTDIRFIDTPYRFQSYQEAREYAKELFPCYSYIVEGSADVPNFNESQFVQRTSGEELQKTKYYDVYGVKRSYMKEAVDSRNSRIVPNKRNNSSAVTILTVEDEIKSKLEDIDALRKKLDQKEAELKRMSEIKNGNTNTNPPAYTNTNTRK